MHFIQGSVRAVRHLWVSFAVIICAKAQVFVPVYVSDVMEWGAEENVGILTR